MYSIVSWEREHCNDVMCGSENIGINYLFIVWNVTAFTGQYFVRRARGLMLLYGYIQYLFVTYSGIAVDAW